MPQSDTIPADRFARWILSARRPEAHACALTVRVERDGTLVYALRVNPPHLDAHARRRLHIWQIWQRVGPLGGLGLGFFLAALTSSTAGLLAGAGACLLGTVVLAYRARVQRPLVRRLRAVDAGPAAATVTELDACVRLLLLAKTMADVEHARASDPESAIEFETTWDRVYSELGR